MDEGRFPIFLHILIPEISCVMVLVMIERIDAGLQKVSRKTYRVDIPVTHKLKIFCDVTMFRAIRAIPFPLFGQRNLRSLDLQGVFKTQDKLVNKTRLCWIWCWKIIRWI